MSKFLLYTDVHLRTFGSFPPYNILEPSGLTKEAHNFLKARTFLIEKIKELQPEKVIFMGDLFHNQEHLSLSELYLGYCFLQPILDVCNGIGAEHIGIPGNHDIANRNGTFNTLEPFHHYFHSVYTVPTIVDNMCFLPYSDDKEALDKFVKEHKPEFLFCHEEFHGAFMETGRPCSHPITYNQHAKKVFSGHLHLRQTVENITYPGSLIQHRFSNSNLDGIGGVLLYENGEETHFINDKSSHYVVVKELEDLEELKMSGIPFVAQIRTYESLETVKDICTSLEIDYQYINIPTKNSPDVYRDLPQFDPIMMLRSWILRKRPDVVSLLDKFT